jgi:hypothetical protein
MIDQINYLNILASLENVTDVGIVMETNSHTYIKHRKELENRQEEFKLCCEWIDKFSYNPTESQFIKSVQTQTYSSYYLKHLVEKWAGRYIPNGAFIAAIKALDIPYRPIYGTPDISVTLFLTEEAISE